MKDDNFLVLLNAHHETVPFVLPDFRSGHWHPMLDTASDTGVPETQRCEVGSPYPLQGRSLALLVEVAGTR